MNISKIQNMEAIAMLTIVMANKIILNLPKTIIASTGSSAWINTIYIIAITFVFVFLVTKLLKKFPDKDILDISEYLGGKKLKIVISIFYILFFITIASLLARNFSEALKIIYFKQSPLIYVVLFMLFSACIANKFGIRAITKSMVFIAPIVFIGLLIILLSPVKHFVIQRFFPILGYGFNATFFEGLTNIFALSGIGYIYLLPTLLKNNQDLRKITLISLAISSIYLFLSVCCLLLVFSFTVDTNENISIYLLTMVANFGSFIHGINTIFIFVWILSIIAYLSTAIFFISFILRKIGNLKNTNSVNYCITSIILGLSLFGKNYAQLTGFTDNLLNYLVIAFVFVVNPILLLIANFKQKSAVQTNVQLQN